MALSASRRRRPQGADYWPGFVDVLSTLLLVLIFFLSVFMLAQFFLSEVLSNRDNALRALENEVSELADLLAMERNANDDLRKTAEQLAASLTAAQTREEAALTEISRLGGLIDERNQAIADLEGKAAELTDKLTAEEEISEQARQEIILLNNQLAALRTQLQKIEQALEVAEERDRLQKAEIVNLGKRLNAALAQKVGELARYRSEFFGQLRAALGYRDDIRIDGDRFVFQSEVLFESGSAKLNEAGKTQLLKVASALLEISDVIPPQLRWVLRVDGHTDAVPINTNEFPSNWELSTARATSVVKYLINQGVPPRRLAATGFGQYQPLIRERSRAAYRMNRRIELKLTER